MIYTVTLNPSLDYMIFSDEVHLGTINQSQGEVLYPGGKGLNVSYILTQLGHENKALGFQAGFTGEELERLLNEAAVTTDFIKLPKGNTRINVKLRGQAETDINCQGPNITQEAIAKLNQKLKAVNPGDTLIIAGSIPKTLPKDTYEQMISALCYEDITLIIDASDELLLNTLPYRPFLIKPNVIELGSMFDTVITTRDEILFYAKKAQSLGARNVLISMAQEGALLLTESGEIFSRRPPEGKLVNSVGAGDAMVAGFVAGWLEQRSYAYGLKLGTACGSATAFNQWLGSFDDINTILKSMLDENKAFPDWNR